MNDAVETDPLLADREAGVCLHITSLPGRYGIGELGREAHKFVDAMTRMQLRVWQFLPLGPTAYGDSPYQPLSTFAGNEMLVDMAGLVDLGLLSDDETARLTGLPAEYVDYGKLIPLKSELLVIAASRFDDVASKELKSQYTEFLASNDRHWLHDYALFRILKLQHDQRAWPEWRPEFVHRDSQALAELEKTAAQSITEIKTIQFLFHYQWQKLKTYANTSGVRLFGDMPIYIALDSADAWANREIVRIDDDGRPEAVAGVPPDYFSEDGQLWGNPLYDWDQHAATGYAWWIDRLRATAQHVDMVRVDHFRGFESYWTVPADAANARTGAWEAGPGDALFDALRRALGQLPIVAEDLGIITDEVDELRNRQKIPGMAVLQFQVTDPDFDLAGIGDNTVIYTGTHDNDTTLGWFSGGPDDNRSDEEVRATQQASLSLTQGAPTTIHLDMIRLALSSAARLAIAPMQDFVGLGSEARINTPGTSTNNWSWRLLDTQLTDKLCDNIAGMVSAAGRDLSA